MKNISQKGNSFELTQSINLDKMRPKGFHKKIELLLSSINKIVSSKVAGLTYLIVQFVEIKNLMTG